MKKILALVLALSMLLAFTSCTGTKTPDTTTTETASVEKTDINIAVLKGPTGMGAAYLMNKNADGTSANNYNFSIESTPDAITGQLVSGDLDMAAVPTNLACVIENKGAVDIKIIAVNTLGVLYVLEKGDTVNSISDLNGKKIIASGQGSTAEAIISKLLGDSGADITYASEHAEAVTLAASGDYDICILPEPFVTTLLSKDIGYRIALNLTELWKAADLGELPMGGIVVRTAFLNEHPDAVKSFLTEYKESVDYTNNNIDEASAIIEEYGIMTADIAKAAIPNCNIVCLTGTDMVSALSSFYTVLNNFNASLIGGQIPADTIYYTD